MKGLLAICAVVTITLLALPAQGTATSGGEIVGVFTQFHVNGSNASSSGFHINANAASLCMCAPNLDFIGGDLLSTKGGPETCCGQCKRYAACRAYTWTDYQGGTCWLKNNVGVPRFYQGSRACTIETQDFGYSMAQFSNCDMPGNDMREQPMPEEDFDICEKQCGRRLGACRAVTWTNFEGGTCWPKWEVTSCVNYPGAKSTVPFNDRDPN